VITTSAKEIKLLNINKDNTVILKGTILGNNTKKAYLDLLEKLQKNKKPVYIVLSSPGGNVDTLETFTFLIKKYNLSFHTISLNASSAAFSIFQRGKIRYIHFKGTLMQHQWSIYIHGYMNRNKTLQLLKNLDIMERPFFIYESKRLKVTLKEYKQLIKNDLRLNAEEALKYNAADYIVKFKCDSFLKKELGKFCD